VVDLEACWLVRCVPRFAKQMDFSFVRKTQKLGKISGKTPHQFLTSFKTKTKKQKTKTTHLNACVKCISSYGMTSSDGFAKSLSNDGIKRLYPDFKNDTEKR
jgi:hypothetical protein